MIDVAHGWWETTNAGGADPLWPSARTAKRVAEKPEPHRDRQVSPRKAEKAPVQHVVHTQALTLSHRVGVLLRRAHVLDVPASVTLRPDAQAARHALAHRRFDAQGVGRRRHL